MLLVLDARMMLALCFVGLILMRVNYCMNMLSYILQKLNNIRVIELDILHSSCLSLTVVGLGLLVEGLFRF